MKSIDWKKLEYKVPKKFSEPCSIAFNLHKKLDTMKDGVDRGMVLDSDLISVKDKTIRLISFTLSLMRSNDVDEKDITKFEENTKKLITLIHEKESKKALRDVGIKRIPVMTFYIGEFYTFLGLFYDSVKETLISIEDEFEKQFCNIISIRQGVYPEITPDKKRENDN